MNRVGIRPEDFDENPVEIQRVLKPEETPDKEKTERNPATVFSVAPPKGEK